MNKSIPILLALSIAATLTACGESDEEKKKTTTVFKPYVDSYNTATSVADDVAGQLKSQEERLNQARSE